MTNGPSVSGGPSPANSLDLSQPLFLVLEQFKEETQISPEELEEFIDELMDEILSKPPEYRFEKSTEVVKSCVIERFGSEEVYASLLAAGPEQLTQLLKGTLEFWINQIVGGVNEAEGEDLASGLVYLSALATFREVVEAVDEGSLSEQDQKILASSTIAIYVRILNEHKQANDGHEVNWEAIIEDTLRAREKLDELSEEDQENIVRSPDELSLEDGARDLRIYGAVVLYDKSDISIGRGAEMAQVTQDEFKQYLIKSGVRPRLGPTSAEDFGSDLSL